MNSLVPPTLPGQPCLICHKRRKLFLALLAVVAIAAGVISFWWWQEDHANFYEGYSTAMEGSVVIFTPDWQTPTGQYQSVLAYSLASGAVHTMALPDDSGVPIAASLSPNTNDFAVAFLQGSTMSQLMLVPNTHIGSSTVIDSEDTAMLAFPAAWSLDNSAIAYAVPADSPTNSPAKAKAYLYDRTTKKTTSLGSGVPVGVSPDDTQAILFDGEHIAFSSEQKTIPSIDLDAPVFAFSTDGELVAIANGGATDLYRIDWDKLTLTKIGEIPVAATAAIFSNAGNLLLVDAQHVLHAYSFTNKGFYEYGRKKTSLPASVTLLSWES